MKGVQACAGLIGLLLLPSIVCGQYAVVDAGAIARLVQQIETMRQQLTVARNQLTRAEQQLNAMSGQRGMERLLAGTVRNYLPPDWAQLEAAILNGTGNYRHLASEVQRIIDSNAVLTDGQIASLSPAARQQLEQDRRDTARLQVLTRQALSVTSARFDAIEQLVQAIPRASDQKAILDLQARIAVEQGMLENEQTKLTLLYQISEAEKRASAQRARERAMSDIGSLRDLPPMGL